MKKNLIFIQKIEILGKIGFTLAEILITLGIIGIVAAFTIPTVLSNFQDVELHTLFKKSYSIVSQVWHQVYADNPNAYTARGGWTCTWPTGESADYNANDGRIDAIKANMNVTRSCSNQAGCWPDNYENVSDIIGIIGGNIPTHYGWVTADGMCWSAPWKNVDEASIIVDTNCNKGPNLIGQDIFSFLLGADGIVYFAIDDKSTTGKPVSNGSVCPMYNNTTTISGRTVKFKDWLQ